MLTQLVDEIHKPIVFASRTLNHVEQNYSTEEKKLLSIIWSIKQNCPYLFGHTFTVRTDHKPLTWLLNVKDPNSHLVRWQITLQEYDYEIEYIAGSKNKVADCLSHLLLTTAQQSTSSEYPPMTSRNYKEISLIATFASPDQVLTNPLLKETVFQDLRPREIRILKKTSKTIFICCLHEHQFQPHDKSLFQKLLKTLKNMANKFPIQPIVIHSDIDPILTRYRRKHCEKLLNNALQP